MREKILIVVLIHIIGVIVTMIIHYKNGTFEYAAKHGDGIRFANPSDVIFVVVNAMKIMVSVLTLIMIRWIYNHESHVQFEKGEII